jgi:hypothetical protein
MMDLNKLKEPLNYQWRVQECKEYGANCVAYIDSRDVQDRLDEVVGIGNWQCDYKEVKGVVYCGIAIKTNDDWIWKWDCGTESNVEKEKGEASDSFKRAAVKWGIGRFLYDLKIVKLKTIKYEKNGKYYPLNESTSKPIFDGKDLTAYVNNLIKPKTTAHNHKPIGNGLPVISNADFQKLVEESKAGNKEAIEAAKKKWAMDETQLTLLRSVFNKPALTN